jgi:hypothetical protein
MALVPDTKIGKIQFFQSKIAPWTANQPSVLPWIFGVSEIDLRVSQTASRVSRTEFRVSETGGHVGGMRERAERLFWMSLVRSRRAGTRFDEASTAGPLLRPP